ncbi:Flap endonuclease GEN 1 [Hypsizygus marmoreus]|uniref:Flap endonuclease GEN 1 n=1 Tax=Hypsizygus marmoreus TaxID=39966 RepID=A0A369JXS8_HYPMA|nr:Flap endonuclease GEN 1 [Hypsizygus marmoreus]
MGVPGLWKVLENVGQQRALAHLAVIEGFEGNRSTKRAYRLGIDVSIWYRHAQYSKEGENPLLRLLFFRLRQLVEMPILPLFVFDGRDRPKVKRGSKMGKSGSHALNAQMKEMLDAFGMEWRMARGEAEAELAYLNRKGYIDGILTDDCDALVFGGCTIIKNWGALLSGNRKDEAAQQNKPGKNKPQVMIYSADDIQNKLGLKRGDLILFALLAGGDYHEGLKGFGQVKSSELAGRGFGQQLLAAYEQNQQNIGQFLVQWRANVNAALRDENSRGSLSLPADFPNLKILEFYAKPVHSATAGSGGGGHMRDKGELNLGKLAGFCEKYFEWGYKTEVVKRFRSLMWPAAVMHVLRRAALEADEKERENRLTSGIQDRTIRGPLKPSRAEAVGTPASLIKRSLASTAPAQNRYASAFVNQGSQATAPRPPENIPDPHPLITEITRTRRHQSTGEILEYRIKVCPTQLVAFTCAGIMGTRAEPDPSTKKQTQTAPPDPNESLLLWVPGSMLHQAHPGLVEDYAMKEEAKKNKQANGKGKRKARDMQEDDEDEDEPPPSPPPTQQVPIEPQHRTHEARPTPPEFIVDKPALDPWFMSGEGESMRFLFSFPDPDPPQFSDDEPDSHFPPPGNEDMVLSEPVHDMPPEDDMPRNDFDRLCDAILDGRSKKPNAKKPRIAKGTKQRSSSSSTSSRIRASDDILTKLDKLEARQAAKRRRVSTQTDELFVVSSQPFPLLPELSDPQRASSSRSYKPSASSSQNLASLPRHVYPEPSSSQESRLSPWSDDFIDLT